MLKCNIVKQLLPNFVDGLLDEESAADINEHLEGCPACREVCEALEASIEKPDYEPAIEDQKEIDFLAKVKRRNVRKIVLAVGITLVSLLLVFVLCLKLFFWGSAVQSGDLVIEPSVMQTEEGPINMLRLTLTSGQQLLVHSEPVFSEETGEFVQVILRPVQAYALPFDEPSSTFGYGYGGDGYAAFGIEAGMGHFTILLQLADKSILYTENDFKS